MSKFNDHLNYEEDFYSGDRKSEKKFRKELSLKDRSKYKKTDQDQLTKKQALAPSCESLLKGRVTSIIADAIYVKTSQESIVCNLRGVLKKERSLQKNLIAVGDLVMIELSSPGYGTIHSIEPRYSILSRADNLRRNKEQLIAVNIDRLFIVVSVIMPTLKPSLIDRYIIAAKQGNMEPVIVVNKIDLLKERPASLDEPTYEAQLALYKEFITIYHALDIPIIEVSTYTGKGLDKLKEMMEHKASVFSGQSGVGKTSLINMILGTSLKTSDIVTKTHKGAHTTTIAQLLPLDEDSFCIDTPGIRSFGIWQITQQDLDHYYKEFLPFKDRCRYQNCAHINEPHCGVKDALDEGLISPMRYQSYHDLKTLPDDRWR